MIKFEYHYTPKYQQYWIRNTSQHSWFYDYWQKVGGFSIEYGDDILMNKHYRYMNQALKRHVEILNSFFRSSHLNIGMWWSDNFWIRVNFLVSVPQLVSNMLCFIHSFILWEIFIIWNIIVIEERSTQFWK